MTQDAARRTALYSSYPNLFADPLPWGLEIGDGWLKIVELLCARIDTILRDAPEATFEIKQIKEKFGALRFYYRLVHVDEHTDRAIREAVQTAEIASAHCCEHCGNAGTLANRNGWLATRCRDCSDV